MTPETFLDGKVTLFAGDMLAMLPTLEKDSVDSAVCDPPYHLTSIVQRFGGENAAPAKDYSEEREGATGAYARASAGFMNKKWDGGDIAFRISTWRAVYRVLKPGAHLIAFGGTRTYHRMACAIEDAGFEIRDQLAWVYGSGFPKSRDVSKAIDKAAGAEREVVERRKYRDIRNGHGRGLGDGIHAAMRGAPEYLDHAITAPATAAAARWSGWGTALKPSQEPIVLARKPLSEPTVAANVLRWGTGALNVDGCRVATEEAWSNSTHAGKWVAGGRRDGAEQFERSGSPLGRWPANLIHDGSEEVVAAFPESKSTPYRENVAVGDVLPLTRRTAGGFDDSGSAARFFYTAKADADDRLGSKHPTVKPVDLVQWLVRLVTPKGGTTLDPFAGTGTTGEAAWREGCKAVLIEREEEYQADIRRRMALALAGPDERVRESIKARGLTADAGPLFGGAA